MEPSLRQILLRRLCSKDEPWAVIFVTNYPSIGEYVDRPGDSTLISECSVYSLNYACYHIRVYILLSM